MIVFHQAFGAWGRWSEGGGYLWLGVFLVTCPCSCIFSFAL